MPISTDAIRALEGRPDDYDSLIERIGDARFVLIGEASHGTYEFYRERAEITRRLIVEKHFSAGKSARKCRRPIPRGSERDEGGAGAPLGMRP